MEMSNYQKSILVKVIKNVIYYVTLNVTIAHKNLILLKQKFSHVAFLHNRVETKSRK